MFQRFLQFVRPFHPISFGSERFRVPYEVWIVEVASIVTAVAAFHFNLDESQPRIVENYRDEVRAHPFGRFQLR